MTIQQLNYYIEACRCGAISTAAERLYISPSGLRLALHRIEQELGCKLLDWGAKGVLSRIHIYLSLQISGGQLSALPEQLLHLPSIKNSAQQ